MRKHPDFVFALCQHHRAPYGAPLAMELVMDRYWLTTWTTYGTWVAGDSRGFVSNVSSQDGGPEVRHNVPGTECDANIPALEIYVRDRMIAEPCYLEQQQAEIVIQQFQDTTRDRKFELCAASVMKDHTHLVVGVPGDPDAHQLRELFKSWATHTGHCRRTALIGQRKVPCERNKAMQFPPQLFTLHVSNQIRWQRVEIAGERI